MNEGPGRADAGVPRRIGCACGYSGEGVDDAALRGLVRAHLQVAHPELSYSEEQIHAWVATGARYVVLAGPWPVRPRVEGGDAEGATAERGDRNG